MMLEAICPVTCESQTSGEIGQSCQWSSYHDVPAGCRGDTFQHV